MTNYDKCKKSIQKPFLKWVGGKTQIIDKIINKFPKTINNYHEPFIGGGSVLFALLAMQKCKLIDIKGEIYAYDKNETLIDTYNYIKNNKDELFEYIEKYISIYSDLSGTIINRKPTNLIEAKSSKESYYYWLRNKFNKSEKKSIVRSALFMILNKLCFRGLYREGPSGFNVPYGHYKTTPTIISKKDINNISELIKNVIFECSSFEMSLKKFKKDDFAYFDPPYAPETEKSFVGYTKDGFNIDIHKKLFKMIKKLKNIKFIMSNAKVNLVLKYFKDYNYEEVIARRAINSKNPNSTTTEIIISN